MGGWTPTATSSILIFAFQEREKAAAEQEKRENDIALGNPLLMPSKDTETKRRSVFCLFALDMCYLHDFRWDDDVVFRNQARGTENKGKKEFVNVRDHALDTTTDLY